MTTNAVSFEKTRTATVIDPDLSDMVLDTPEIDAAQAEVLASVAARTAAVEAGKWKLTETLDREVDFAVRRKSQAIRAANPGATEAQINVAAYRG